MKAIILVTTFLLSIAHVFGQGIRIVAADNLTTNLNGTTITVEGDKSDLDIYIDLRVINDNSYPIIVKYKRVREVNSGRMDQICDNELCYPADDINAYTSPAPNPIGAGASGIFKPQIVPNDNESCGIHSYYVVDDLGVLLDSIRVIFKTTKAACNLSTQKETDLTFNIFPNPVQDVVTLKGESIKNGGTVVFLDALGKEVKRSKFTASNNQINVSSLRRGVYFVNIYDQSGTKSTVQRLIKQ